MRNPCIVKRLITLFLLIVMGFCPLSCDRKELNAIIDELNSRLSALEVAKKAFEQNLYVSTVTQNQTGVYSITFSDGSVITISGGKDEKDGDSSIESIALDAEKVTFILTDGTSFSIPFYSAISITINANDGCVVIPGSKIDISFSWVSNLSNVKVESLSSADIQSSVELSTSENKGVLHLCFADTINEYSKVVILASNGEKIAMETLHFEEAGIIISNGGCIHFSANGGTENVSFLTNIGYSIKAPVNCNWLQLEVTKSLQEHELAVTAFANQGYEPRSATAFIVDIETGSSIAAVLDVYQEGADFLSVSREKEYFSSDGGFIEIAVNSTIDYHVELSDAAEWINVVDTKSPRTSTIVLQISKNDTGYYREATLLLTGNELKQDVLIGQFGDKNTISVSHASSGMSIPEIITGDNQDVVSFIDWGDGALEIYQPGIVHQYDNNHMTEKTVIMFKNLPDAINFKDIKGINHIDLSKLL